MMFFTTNLTERSLSSGAPLPWEFQPSETLTAQLRKDKVERQRFYQNPATRHYFYTGIEPANPNARISKENPPRSIHAFVADFDLPVPEARVNEALAAMKIKPSWVERSLGGNVRLVWLLRTPIPVDTFDFCVFALKEAVRWLRLDFLPGIDEPAFSDPARLYCNGCAWRQVGEPVPDADAQAFFVACGKGYRYTPAGSERIPLDVVELAIRDKYPTFSWPSAFEVDTQGPSFWVEGSTTPTSAIVKPDGMFSFSAHASKPFFSWADILGSEFVAQFVTKSVSDATADIYWDSKRFHRKIKSTYCSLDATELQNYFKVNCRMSSKPGSDGLSLIDTALNHIYNEGRITGAAPHLFRPQGLLEFQGKRVLNTYLHRVMQPAEETSAWGPDGAFPFLSSHFDNLFDPAEQKWNFLAWWKAFYQSGHTMLPMPGQNCFLMGGVNVGKTLTSRALVGRSVGGFCDASSFLVNNGKFNSELLESPLWSVDDETMGESSASQTKFQAMLKKTAANQQFQYERKYEVATTVEWMGRIIVTTNLDYVSSRALGPMDDGSADKTNIFRCAGLGKIVFPNRHALAKIIDTELPYLLRWLLAWDPATAGIESDVRYGYARHHEKSLLEQANAGGKSAPFKELLFEALSQYFRENPDAAHWRGPMTQVVRLLHANPLNDAVCKSLRLETGQRYLDMLQRDQSIPCSTEPGPLNTRIWIFPRFDNAPPTPAPNTPEPITLNPFDK